MPPRRYLQGFTLCVPLPEEKSTVADSCLVKRLFVRAEVSLARDRVFDLVVHVGICLFDEGAQSGEGVGECFPTEVHVFAFPDTSAERRARIKGIVALPPLVHSIKRSTERRET